MSSSPSWLSPASTRSSTASAAWERRRWDGLKELLQAANVLSAWATCDAGDDFSSVWRKALSEIGFSTARQAIGFGERVDQTIEAASQLLGPGPVTPHAVQEALQRITRQSAVAIFVDEFDRFRTRMGVCSLQTRSRRLGPCRPVDVVLIGVADSVGELIREHRSVERALVQIQMPRMSASELGEIATKGIAAARMTVAGGAVARITALSQGLPHYTHLLTQLAAQSALGDRRAHVGVRDVDAAVVRAIERAQHRSSRPIEGPSAATRRHLSAGTARVRHRRGGRVRLLRSPMFENL